MLLFNDSSGPVRGRLSSCRMQLPKVPLDGRGLTFPSRTTRLVLESSERTSHRWTLMSWGSRSCLDSRHTRIRSSPWNRRNQQLLFVVWWMRCIALVPWLQHAQAKTKASSFSSRCERLEGGLIDRSCPAASRQGFSKEETFGCYWVCFKIFDGTEGRWGECLL